MFGHALINNRRTRRLLVILLIVSFFLTLMLAMEGLNNFKQFESLFTILLLIGSLALVILLALIVLNLRDLFVQMRKGRAGAMLTGRIVLLYLILAILPALVVYYFSLNFLHQRLDSLFSHRNQVEEALTNAQALHDAVLDAQKSAALTRLQQLVNEIGASQRDLIPLQVNDLYARSNALELNVLDDAGVPIAVGVDAENPDMAPERPEDDILLRMKQSDNYVGLEFGGDNALFLRVLVKLPAEDGVNYFLVNALYPTVERPNKLSAIVGKAADEYKQLLYLRESVETSFILLLSMVSLLSIFVASWLAFYFARHLSAPIRELAAGTKAVANGQYDKQLPFRDHDELGFLVESFNDMTRKIRLASDSAKASQYIADVQRTYLEAVLNHLSSGVLALDHNQCLRTVNASASDILEVPLIEHLAESFSQIAETHSTLQSLWEALAPHVKSETASDWQVETVLFGTKGRKILMCRGARLPTLFDTAQPGHVIVFDDITALVQVQRDAAWSEVARRLAHEIKNPLTPIRLSAERLRHKYLPSFPDKEADTLNRMTRTIITQVDHLKDMVDAFSQYAKPPQIQKAPLDVNELIQDTLTLYQNGQTEIKFAPDPKLPLVDADVGRLRQVLHNVFKNALEAQTSAPKLDITTRDCISGTTEWVEIAIKDYGPGLPEDMVSSLFEPYVTTKPKGTGLGLAIVKKIVEEHNGMVSLENHEAGACVTMRLPVAEPEKSLTENNQIVVITH